MRFFGARWTEFKLGLAACLRRETLAFLAFVAAVAGGAVLTGLLFWSMIALREARQWEYIGNIAYGLLLVVGVVMISLHRLLGSKQAIELEFWKLKASITQGEDNNGPAA